MLDGPVRQQVVAWCVHHGKGAAEAVAEFWPDLAPEVRAARQSTVRTWLRRARQSTVQLEPEPDDSPAAASAPLAPPAAATPGAVPAGSEADYGPGELDRIAFLEWLLAEEVGVFKGLRLRGDARAIPPLTSQILDTREQLDEARQRDGEASGSDDDPTALAEQVREHDAVLRALTDARSRGQAARKAL